MGFNFICVCLYYINIYFLQQIAVNKVKKHHLTIFDSLRANPETDPGLSPGGKNILIHFYIASVFKGIKGRKRIGVGVKNEAGGQAHPTEA